MAAVTTDPLQQITFHCICLRDGQEREQQMRRMLDKEQLVYEVHHFERHANGEEGCRNSHLALYDYAQELGLEYIAVMEDNNCLNKRPSPKQVEALLQFMRSNDQWEMIHLGGFFLPFQKSTLVQEMGDGTALLHSLHQNHGAQCYIIHKRLYGRLTKVLRERPFQVIDLALRDLSEQIYVFVPLLFHHEIRIVSTLRAKYELIELLRKVWYRPVVYGYCEDWFVRDQLWMVSCLCILLAVMVMGMAVWPLLRSKSGRGTKPRD